MKNEPRVIFLNLGDEVTRHDDFKELCEVTWCDEKINDLDIKYTHFNDLRGMLISISGELLRMRTHGFELDKDESGKLDDNILKVVKNLKSIYE